MIGSASSIGIFDSGVGGLTVAAAIDKALPNEHIIYFGDTAHLPYGEKSKESIIEYGLRITEFLLERHCKLIVIACNSASAYAYEPIVSHFGSKAIILNVIDPMVEGVCANQSAKRIGLIGTKATINSQTYQHKLLNQKPDLQIYAMSTPLLAPMVEEGYFEDTVSRTVITNYLDRPEMPHDIDTMILACTHYPLLKEEVKSYYRNKVQVLDSTDYTIQTIYAKLQKEHLLSSKRTENHQFYVSEYTDSFADIAKRFFNEPVSLKHFPLWHLESI